MFATLTLVFISCLIFAVLLHQAAKHFGFGKWFVRYFAFPVVIFSVALMPLAAFAQGSDPGPTVFGVPLQMIVLIWLALVDFAKRVAEAVPGTSEDKIIGVVDAVSRKLIDFLAGRYGLPNDPSMVRKNPVSPS